MTPEIKDMICKMFEQQRKYILLETALEVLFVVGLLYLWTLR